MKKVGAYEAKTHLPKLLDEVEGGEKVVITRHGTAVAVLARPEGASQDPEAVRRAIAALRDFSKGRRLEEDLRPMIEEGRP